MSAATERLPSPPAHTGPQRTAGVTTGPRAIDRELGRLRGFAKVLDAYLVDPILGFIIPGAGDVITSVMGMWIVAVAARRGIAPVVLARMVMNLGIDAAIGVVPLLGDLGDIAFRANTRNLKLLEDRSSTGKGTPGDWALVVGALAAFVGLIALLVWIAAKIFAAISAAVF